MTREQQLEAALATVTTELRKAHVSLFHDQATCATCQAIRDARALLQAQLEPGGAA